MSVILTGGKYFDKDFQLVPGEVKIESGRITETGENLSRTPGDELVKIPGKLVAPGFIDVHIHGCAGASVGDEGRESIDTMARFLLKHGVTSFCPTASTVPVPVIENAIRTAKECAEQPLGDGSRVVGIHLEGPFISAPRKGAQLESAILPPDFELFKRLYDLSGGLIRLVVVAPEQPGGYEFAAKASELCTVSIAHTTAAYEEAMRSFECGVSHATHLFNAMNGLQHREPGVVGAVFDSDTVRGELICDGIHIHPATLRTAFKLLGDRALIVSDSIRAGGMGEGEVNELGEQTVYVKNGKATLADGTIAGSVTNIHDEIRNLVSFGVPLDRAVKAGSLIPAKAIGMDHEIGSIEPGKRADLVLMDEDLNIDSVILGGKSLHF